MFVKIFGLIWFLKLKYALVFYFLFKTTSIHDRMIKHVYYSMCTRMHLYSY